MDTADGRFVQREAGAWRRAPSRLLCGEHQTAAGDRDENATEDESRSRHFFSADVQLSTSVIGSVVSVALLTRKRSPSAVTAYCEP